MDDLAPPIACTLLPGEAQAQVLEWVDLRSHSIDSQALPNGIRLTLPGELAEPLKDLITRESVCCTTLRFSIERIGEVVVLEATSADSDSRAAIARISGVVA